MSLEEVEALEGHDERVWSVCWSPAGDLLASTSGDKTVRIWARDPAGKWFCKAILEEAHTKTIRSCAWAPNGKLLATASFDGTAAVWEYAGGEFECLATLEGHESEVKSVSWNADSTLLATCSRDKSVWIWEIPSAGGGGGVAPGGSVGPTDIECLAVLQGHTQDVKMVKWHPQQNWLASASYDDTIKVWAAEDPSESEWTCVQTLSGAGCCGHSSTVWSLSFDASGKFMVSCSDDLTLKIWDCSSEPGEARASDGNVLEQGAGEDGALKRGWRHLCTVSGEHERTVFTVDWNRRSGLIATGSGDDCIRIFRPNMAMLLQGGQKGEPRLDSCVELVAAKEQAHMRDVNCVAWNPKDEFLLASAGDDELLKIWSLKC